MVNITIETNELTLGKRGGGDGHIDEWHVAQVIAALVDAYDAAHSHKDFSVRKELIKQLSKQ